MMRFSLMNWKPQLPRGSFLLRLIAANAVIFAACLIILSVVNYTFTNAISEKQISETHKGLLNQTNANIATLYERVFQIGEQLLNDKDVIKGLYSARLDPGDSLTLERRLHDVVSVNDFINSVYLYNGATGRFIHTVPHDVEIAVIDPDARQLVQIRNSLGRMIFLPHRQSYTYAGKAYDNPILSLIFTQSDNAAEYAIFINLKLSSLQDLFDKMGNSADSNFMIAGKDGVMIARSDNPDSFLDDSADSFMVEVASAGKAADSFVANVSGSKSLITYIYNEKLEWYLVNVTRYAYLTRDSFILQRNIVGVSLLVLLGCLLATVMMNRRLYNPIGNVIRMAKGSPALQTSGSVADEAAFLQDVFKNLISRVALLEDSAVQDRKKLKEGLLKDILLREEMTGEAGGAIHFEQQGLRFRKEPLRVFAITLEDIRESADTPAEAEMKLVKEAVYELALHIFHGHEEMEKADTGSYSFVLIMNDQPDRSLKRQLDEFAFQVKKMTGLRLKVGVGRRVPSIQELAYSFRTAREALAYEFVESGRLVYDYDYIKGRTTETFVYPVKLERALFDAIKLNDSKAAQHIAKEWFEQLQQYAVADIRLALRQSVMRIESEFSAMVDFSMLVSDYGMSSLESVVHDFPSLERVKAFYAELAIYMIAQLKKKRHKESGAIVQRAVEHIGRHYQDNDLSADSVAAALNISVPYFSKLFNEAMGVSFTQYVTELRLKEAESLLLGTSLNVKEIGERVGFLNSSYFITVFKKRCGASPNQFRQLKKG